MVVEYQLQQEVTLLRGMLEEQSYKIKQMEQDQLDRYKDIDSRLSGMNSAPASGSGGAGPEVADTQEPAANAGASAAPPDPEREKLMYDASFDLVKARDFEKAAQAFTAFLRRYPDSQYAGNAQYWLGEVYLVQSDLESAGRAFAQVISRYPDHRKESDAMYKLGDVERRLLARALLDPQDHHLDQVDDDEPRQVVGPDEAEVDRVELRDDEAARGEQQPVDEDLRDDGGEEELDARL